MYLKRMTGLLSPYRRFLTPLMAIGLLFSACAPRNEPVKTPTTPTTPPQPSEKEAHDPSVPSWSSPVPDDAPQKQSSAKAPRHAVSSPVQLRYPRGRTPWLGVELRATSSQEPGVRIVRILPGSPAQAAKMQAGDILLTMGETPVQSPVDVSTWVRSQKLGTAHPLAVLRNGKTQLLRAKLEGIPEFEDRLRLAFVNKKAPEIAGVATFQGEASSLGELKGKVVLLEFWASFCGVCRYLGPVLDDWHRTYRPQGAHVVGITVDAPQAGLRAARDAHMGYTLASDSTQKITQTYMAAQIPTVFIIDREGIVRDVMVGYSRKRLEETKNLLESLLLLDP